MYEAFPLQWPSGYNRTPEGSRINSIFKQTMDKAQQFLRAELSRMNVTDLVISTNIPVRKDGGLYADYMNRRIDDPGVAIYFKYRKKDVSMCCDQYLRVWENIYALGKGIEALRGMGRWGVSEFLDRAFTVFAALPESNAIAVIDIWLILGLNVKPANKETLINAYKQRAKECHPDTPNGDKLAFQLLVDAYEKALSFYK